MDEQREAQNAEPKEDKTQIIEENSQNSTFEKKKSAWRYPIRIAVIFLILAVVYTAILMMEKVKIINSVFENIDEEEALLTEYIVYGTHLNIKGSLNIGNQNVSDVKLCFKTANEQNIKEINLDYTNNNNNIEFSTSDLINEGIYLENLNVDMYYLFIKVTDTEGVSKYYSLKNATKYDDVIYYTITRNNKNKKINIGFSTHESNEQNINYMYLSVNFDTLPEDVYDIVIDPGHGGKDVGAQANRI